MLMDSSGDIFLSDFGVSAHVKGGQRRMTFVGSPCWMAPEVMEQEKGYDFKADIWSLGMTAIELAMGDVPNSDQPPLKVLMIVLHSEPSRLPADEPWSAEFRQFIDACLQREPTKRATALDLLTKPEFNAFLSKAQDSNYIKSRFLTGLQPLEERIGRSLQAQAKEYHEKKDRQRQLGGGNGKQRTVAKKPDAEQGASNGSGWDFGNSGEYSHLKDARRDTSVDPKTLPV